MRLVPQGAIPQDTQLGIHLTPAVTPGGGCAPQCDGWGVIVNSVTATGDVINVPDAAFSLTASLIGTLCDGQCITWALRSTAAVTIDEQIADLTVTANCTGVTVTGAGSVTYAGMEFGLFPTIDGKPFCRPVIVRTGACTEDVGVATAAQLTYGSDGQFPCGIGTRCFITASMNPVLCGGDSDTITWNLTQTGGTGGNGENMALQSSPDPWVWFLEFSSIVDLTGSSFTASPVVNGVDHTELALTFSYDVVND